MAAGSSDSLACTNALSCSSSLALCSMIPMYWRTLVLVIPAWPPSMSVIVVLSHPVLLNSDSTPDDGGGDERKGR